MGIVALVGDCTTTTAIAIAAAWPRDADVTVVEADRSGGSLAGWLGTPAKPSLSTLVSAPDGPRWHDVEAVTHRTSSGVRFIAAPVRAREAARAIDEAGRSLVPLLAGQRAMTMLADVGRMSATDPIPSVVSAANTIVIVHRQDTASAGAATVRLERLVELTEYLGAMGAHIALAVIGQQPFDIDEIVDYVAEHSAVRLHGSCPIAIDPLSALVFAGRSGVSSKRLARLPLARSVAALVDLLDTTRFETPRTVWIQSAAELQ